MIKQTELVNQTSSMKIQAKRHMIAGFPAVCAVIDRALEKAGAAEQVCVAIDGVCGSGKTTLGEALAEKYECNLFHMDDFFLRPEQRTPERYAQAGGNVDYERFRSEVLARLADKDGFTYRRFDCHTLAMGEAYSVPWRRLNVIEGAYSCHPYFGDVFQVRLFMDVPPKVQRERIIARNGREMYRRFERQWIPMENRYFEAYGIRGKCLAVDGSGAG